MKKHSLKKWNRHPTSVHFVFFPSFTRSFLYVLLMFHHNSFNNLSKNITASTCKDVSIWHSKENVWVSKCCYLLIPLEYILPLQHEFPKYFNSVSTRKNKHTVILSISSLVRLPGPSLKYFVCASAWNWKCTWIFTLSLTLFISSIIIV